LGTTASLGADELGSAAQRDRRKRILDATIEIAGKGGFDAVQMRAVAERAEVALGTLYRYFPSKIHLLVSALGRQFEAYEANGSRRPIPGDTAAERVSNLLTYNTRSLQRQPQLTEALTRAFMFADASVADEIHTVGLMMSRMVARAMHGEGYDESADISDDDVAITRVISDVWLAALVAWVTGRSTADEVSEHVDFAIRMLLREEP
jgi:TetR/AcrR family transcriptional regulator, cholesterol catabolism regulator